MSGGYVLIVLEFEGVLRLWVFFDGFFIDVICCVGSVIFWNFCW